MEHQEISTHRAGGAVLAGTLTLPGHRGVFPAVVAVHGSGGGVREATELRHLRSLLPRHGIATLTFDRRGEGSSSGAPGASFEQLAGDVQTWVARLRKHANVNPAAIGLWAISQGGWIAPLAAAEDAGIAFLVAISPSGISPSEQMVYAATTQLRDAGYSESVVERVGLIRRQIDAEYRRGNLQGILALIEGARGEPWFPVAHLPTPDLEGQWARILDFDPRPSLKTLNLPILLILGQHDRSVPVNSTANIWRSCLGPGVDVNILSIRAMGHSPLLAEHHNPTEAERVAAEYERLLVGWLRRWAEFPSRSLAELAPKEPWISAKVQLKPSRIHGTGMVAVERIRAGERVVVFGGDYTDAARAQRARKQGKLVMQWDEDLFSVEERGDDPTYFINHSCDPNLWMNDAFTLVARRQVEAGEELLADYALWEADEEYVLAWLCRCGTTVCRKTVTGNDWRLPEIQRKYAGHFSPLLNKRIAAMNSRSR